MEHSTLSFHCLLRWGGETLHLRVFCSAAELANHSQGCQNQKKDRGKTTVQPHEAGEATEAKPPTHPPPLPQAEWEGVVGRSALTMNPEKSVCGTQGHATSFLPQNRPFKVKACVCAQSLQSTLCDPMGCSPPGSSVHGLLQARTLEWAAIPFSRGSSQPRDQPASLCLLP